MYDTFIFDLDGTLVTHEMDFTSHKKELERIVLSHGLPDDKIIWKKGFIDTFNDFREEFSRMGIDGEMVINKLIQSIREYEISRAPHTREIPGAVDALRYLKNKGYKIAIVTRNNKDAARISIKNAGLDEYTDAIFTREDTQAMKPKIEQFKAALNRLGSSPKNTVVIGDYCHEIDAGNKMGCLTIGVLTGSGDKDMLKDAKLLLNSVTDIKNYF